MAKKRASKKRSAKSERYPPTWTPNPPRRHPRRKQEWVGSRAGRTSKAPAYPLPPGCWPAHEVAAAAGGRVVVGNQAAKGLRPAWWQDNDSGAWHKFSDDRHHDPHSFRQPGTDSIFRTGLWSRLRPMEGTRENRKWPSPTYENVRVALATLASDPPELTKPYKPKRKTKPKKKRAQKPREPVAPPPPPPAPTAAAVPNDKLPAAQPKPVKPAKFFKDIQQTRKQQPDETTEAYAQELYRLSEKIPLTRPWKPSTFLRRLREQERQARVQKGAK